MPFSALWSISKDKRVEEEGKMDSNGTTWEELQKQLFSEKEIKESKRRAEELMKKRQQNGQNETGIGFDLILVGFELILIGFYWEMLILGRN